MKDLNALLSPLSLEEFKGSHWPLLPFVTHDLSSSISELTNLPFLKSLDAMLAAWPGNVQVHLADKRDESSSIDVAPAIAKRHFNEKLALLFNNVQNISPVLKEWLANISADLGLPKSTYSRCMVYATPDGKGTAAHFDQNINFVLQLHGTKTWWLAPNFTFVNPTERFTIGQPVDPELASYALEEPPTTMPEPQEKIVLKPGSMLFVPRGYWHRTEAEGEALALNFTFSQPTWIDLLLLALRSRLSLSPEWRELAKVDEPARFDNLLAELVEDLPNWQAEDILGATEG